jgi:hypothetical protein
MNRDSGKSRSVQAALAKLILTASSLAVCPAVGAADLSVVKLFDGERTGALGSSQFLNNWGGPFSAGSVSSIQRDATVSHTGAASVRVNLGTIAAGGSGFFSDILQRTLAAKFPANPRPVALREFRNLRPQRHRRAAQH